MGFEGKINSMRLCLLTAIGWNCEIGVIEYPLSTAFIKTICKNHNFRLKLAARLGFEPRQNESESFVLPLHHQAVDCCESLFSSPVAGRVEGYIYEMRGSD